jgi:nitrate reductase gamma subunit
MWILFWTYFCIGLFVVAAGLRIYKQLKMPVHLRWELYPVMTEGGDKPKYGGSYLEELNWWEKKREHSLWNEITFMAPEILLLRGLWEENKKLWWVSFPFHFGLYLLIGTFGLLFIGALAQFGGVTIDPSGGILGAGIYYLTILLGFAGLTLGLAGSIGLIGRRLIDSDLKKYTAISDMFNLFLFLAFFAAGLAAWLLFDHSFAGARGFVTGLLTFQAPETLTLVGTATAFLAAFAIGYIPLTHMSHMFMKYFMYHSIRWEDTPNTKGSQVEAAIIKNLGFKPTWSAAHIGADGSKTWVDVATTVPEVEKKK